MLGLIVYAFTLSIYSAATAMPETLHMAPIAIVDEDGSPLSSRITASFYPPRFLAPALISLDAIDPGMDAGRYTFVLVIPPDFQRDVLAGRSPQIQLNVDATRMSQAFTGSGYVQQIVMGEVQRVREALSRDDRAAGGPRSQDAFQPEPGASRGSARWARSSTGSRCCRWCSPARR